MIFSNHHGNFSEVSAVLFKKPPKCCFFTSFLSYSISITSIDFICKKSNFQTIIYKTAI